MEKVAVVTICDMQNYGNRLQNLAVSRLLKELGYEAVTLDIFEKRYYAGRGTINSVKQLLPVQAVRILELYRELTRYGVRHIPERMARRRNFLKFTRRYLATRRLLEENGKIKQKFREEDYEFFVVGSDQVWNPYFAGQGHDFLDFVRDKKKMALAASIGLEALPEEIRMAYSSYWKRFELLTVRELSTKKIVEQESGKSCFLTLDPTLFVSRSFWESVEKRPGWRLPERYILSFFIGNIPEQAVRAAKKKERMPVIRLNEIGRARGYSIGPQEFLYLLGHAELVLTDSFHVTAFSVIFHRQFYVFEREEEGGTDMFSRIDYLLETLALQDRKWNPGILRQEENIKEARFDHAHAVIRQRKDELMKKIKATAAGWSEAHEPA